MLTLLVLVPFIGASRQSVLKNEIVAGDAAISTGNAIGKLTEKFTLLCTEESTVYDEADNYENIVNMGEQLYSMTLNTEIEIVIKILDKKVGELNEQANYNPAAALVNSFIKDQAMDKIVTIALEAHAFDLLKILQYFYNWSSSEQFHWFQALGYKSPWYDESLWQTHPMDWNKNHEAIFIVDNPVLLNDLVSGIISENPLTFDNDTLLDLIAKWDSLKIYQSLNFASNSHLATRLGILAEFGSFNLLLPLLESSQESLNLDKYPLPKKLPTNPSSFTLFFKHGYRFLPVSHFLEMACESGRVDVIEYFYKLDNRLRPDEWCLGFAALNGHSNVLSWAIDAGLLVNHKILLGAILNGHYKIFHQFEKYCKDLIGSKQKMSNIAAYRNNLNAVKWIYNEFSTVPELNTLYNVSTDMLQWVESIKPRRINAKLAIGANLNNLKWLWAHRQHLFIDDLKDTIIQECIGWEKMQWIVENWQAVPLDLKFAAISGDLKGMKWAFKKFNIMPSEADAKEAAENGHLDIIKWIYKIIPLSVNRKVAESAAEKGYWEISEYIDSIERAKSNYWWVPQRFSFHTLPNLNRAIELGQLQAVETAFMHHYSFFHANIILVEELLKFAVKFDQPQIYVFILKSGHFSFLTASFFIDNHLKLAFELGKLEMLRCLVKYSRYSLKIKENSVNMYNYHLKQWLIENGLWNRVDYIESMPTGNRVLTWAYSSYAGSLATMAKDEQ